MSRESIQEYQKTVNRAIHNRKIPLDPQRAAQTQGLELSCLDIFISAAAKQNKRPGGFFRPVSVHLICPFALVKRICSFSIFLDFFFHGRFLQT